MKATSIVAADALPTSTYVLWVRLSDGTSRRHEVKAVTNLAAVAQMFAHYPTAISVSQSLLRPDELEADERARQARRAEDQQATACITISAALRGRVA